MRRIVGNISSGPLSAQSRNVRFLRSHTHVRSFAAGSRRCASCSLRGAFANRRL